MPFMTIITTANIASRARAALPCPAYITAAIMLTSMPVTASVRISVPSGSPSLPGQDLGVPHHRERRQQDHGEQPPEQEREPGGAAQIGEPALAEREEQRGGGDADERAAIPGRLTKRGSRLVHRHGSWPGSGSKELQDFLVLVRGLLQHVRAAAWARGASCSTAGSRASRARSACRRTAGSCRRGTRAAGQKREESGVSISSISTACPRRRRRTRTWCRR